MGAKLSRAARVHRRPADDSATVVPIGNSARQEMFLPDISPASPFPPFYLAAGADASISTAALPQPLLPQPVFPEPETFAMDDKPEYLHPLSGQTTPTPSLREFARLSRSLALVTEEANSAEQNVTFANPQPLPIEDFVARHVSPTTPAHSPDTFVACAVCGDNYTKSLESIKFVYPCRDCVTPYCTACLKEFFVGASNDLSRMPPMCCHQIPLHIARPYLTEAQAANYRARYEEWSTPKPFYCPVPTCSAFISKKLLKKARDAANDKHRSDSVVGTPVSPSIQCPDCSTSVCTNCRGLAHDGIGCKQLNFGVDDATAELLKGWGYKRCPKCGHGVRRMLGCSHMACLCGAHWCWVCQLTRDECDGGCYDSDDEDYTDDEDDIIDEEPTERVNDPPNEPTNAPDDTTTAPLHNNRPPTPLNLDGRSARYWGNTGIDFGAEPREQDEDPAWNCQHDFRRVKLRLDKLSRAQMECTECWNPVHPEIEFPEKLGRGTERMVASHGRGRIRRKVGRLGGAASATPTSPRSRSYERDVTAVSGSTVAGPLVSDNGSRIVNTYGDVLSSSDFIFNPAPPRRASFDFTAQPTMSFADAGPLSRTTAPDLHLNTFLAAPETTPPPFSVALSCVYCAHIVCSACRVEMIKEGRVHPRAIAKIPD